MDASEPKPSANLPNNVSSQAIVSEETRKTEQHQTATKFWSKEKIVILLLGILVIVLLIIVFLLISRPIPSQDTNSNIIPTADKSQIDIEDDSEVTNNDVDTTTEIPDPKLIPFTETFIDGFEFSYLDNWDLTVKKLNEPNTAGFISTYTPECDDYCAGIRLKKGNANIEMIFNQAFDSAGFYCRDDLKHFQEVGNSWGRFDSTYPTISEDYVTMPDYVYLHGYRLDEEFKTSGGLTVDENGYYTFGEGQDYKGHVFPICTSSAPLFGLRQEGEFRYGYRASFPVLFIDGVPDPELLSEVDQMIATITYK